MGKVDLASSDAKDGWGFLLCLLHMTPPLRDAPRRSVMPGEMPNRRSETYLTHDDTEGVSCVSTILSLVLKLRFVSLFNLNTSVFNKGKQRSV